MNDGDNGPLPADAMHVARLSSLFLPACGLLWMAGCEPRPTTVATIDTPVQAWTYDQDAVIRGDRSNRRLALIFTGGEHGEGTGHILDTLAACNVRASFFVTGAYTANQEHHPLLRRMVAEGHYLGPHSDGHLLYCAWDDRSHTLISEHEFKRDLQTNIDDLKRFGAITEGQPVYFIPPYEWYNRQQVCWAADMDVVLFNFTPGSGSHRDWIPESDQRFASSQTILRDILAYEQKDPHGLNGFLLLMHLGAARGDKMFRLLGPLVDELSVRGYRFVRIDEMLLPPSTAPAA